MHDYLEHDEYNIHFGSSPMYSIMYIKGLYGTVLQMKIDFQSTERLCNYALYDLNYSSMYDFAQNDLHQGTVRLYCNVQNNEQ